MRSIVRASPNMTSGINSAQIICAHPSLVSLRAPPLLGQSWHFFKERMNFYHYSFQKKTVLKVVLTNSFDIFLSSHGLQSQTSDEAIMP